LKELLSYSASVKSDLIIVGRKNERKSGGVLNTRIARRASCSLMILPSDSSFRVKNILVPIDFSEYSTLAFELAIRIAKKTGAKITTQNVYQIPVGYHYTGKSKKEFAAVMESHASKAFDKLCKEVDLKDIKVEQIYTQSPDDNIMEDVYKVAKKISADSIIIGAKGRTAATALFIGSKAEKLIQLDEKFPLIIVRPKGKNAGIIEYLKEL
ncbi:MAG: universal stress protein, partial [Cyclobacteriaceae bacterium]